MNLTNLNTQLEALGIVRTLEELNDNLYISMFNESFAASSLDAFLSIAITEISLFYPNTEFVVMEGNAIKAKFSK